MNALTTHLPVSPSTTLIKFADEIATSTNGPILDAPCGYGRNAVALAARGCAVICVDADVNRLNTLESTKAAYIAKAASSGVRVGRITTVCIDLLAVKRWPFAASSMSAIICVHFPVQELLPQFTMSLRTGGYLYIETFGGQGKNYLDLPKKGYLHEILRQQFDIKYYKERKVGPSVSNAVAVKIFARKLMFQSKPTETIKL